MMVSETIIFFVFAVWLSVSILYCIFNRQLGIYTNRWDLFRWISAYQMFSRTMRNFRLSYREKMSDDTETDWKTIQLIPPPKWHQTFWFPEGFAKKAVYSIVDDTARFRDAKQTIRACEKISERFIYKFILRFIRQIPAAGDVRARQFKIEETGGYCGDGKKREIFVSEFHLQ